MVWADVSYVYGLQFTTNNGRMSPHYGGTAGTPIIMSSEDGVLVAFSGLIVSNLFYRLQVGLTFQLLVITTSNQVHIRQFGATTL